MIRSEWMSQITKSTIIGKIVAQSQVRTENRLVHGTTMDSAQPAICSAAKYRKMNCTVTRSDAVLFSRSDRNIHMKIKDHFDLN